MTKFELKAEVNIQGIFLKDPQRAITIFEEEFRKSLEIASSLIQRDVIRGTPVFQGGRGGLSGSILREVLGRGLSLHAIIGTPVIYANWIETGKPPHFPNTENLKEWVRIKLGVTGRDLDRLTFVIARRMSKVGLKTGHWMFRNAFRKSKVKVQKILDKTAVRVIERWNN